MNVLKDRIFAFCLVCLFPFGATVHSQDLLFPDFKASMLRETSDRAAYAERQALYDSANSKFVKIFEENYRNNIHEFQNEESSCYRIPPIVHQIWLGSEVPEKYRAWMESWMEIRGWKYMLWTDEEVRNFQMQNRDLFELSENWGEKSDIFRLEVLFKYGGVYVDTDFECIRPECFEKLHKGFDFYIGFEPLEHGFIGKFNMFKMCNALIGAIPDHPLIKDLVENMRANFLAYRRHAGPIGTTGPGYLTRIICEYVENRMDSYRNMYFPTTFFYPFSAIDIERFNPDLPCSFPIFLETLGIHYWNMSWVKKEQDNEYHGRPCNFPYLELKNEI
jgi:mannosyltransferase OCH1-like enzyme